MTETSPDFLEIFRDEADERLDHIVDTLLALEADRAPADAVDSLFRDAHTIKGAAGMLGLEDVQELAHAVEDVLDGLRASGEFPPELTDPLLRAADSLRRHVHGSGEATDDLLEELARSRVGKGPRIELPDVEELRAPTPAPEVERRSIRISAEKLDRLLDLVGETLLHRRRLEHELGEWVDRHETVSDELDTGDRLLGELQDTAIQMRTLPLTSITGPFPRAVRDIAAAEGKQVELVVTGAETELDRVILESLSEPLVHLLRNSVAHGIETPDEREQAGKPRAGRVHLRAEQRGRTVAVTVADDGRGAPEEAVEEARRSGETLVDVLTAPGFSTSTEVTDLSGRGVGLHVVRTSTEGFGGTMEMSSEPGQGMTITLLLPLTLALLDVLLVERAGQAFGIPLASVEEAVTAGGRTTSVEVHGDTLPAWDLAGLIGMGDPPPPPESAPALIVSASGRRAAAVCDALGGEEEVVVKSLGPLLSPLSGYLGAAILGDGRVALLLDPSVLVRPPRQNGRPASIRTPTEKRIPTILVVEDSHTVRELQRSILEAAGYRVAIARDGREALQRIEQDGDIGLVVTDLEMPGVDGLQLVRSIRGDRERSSLPVIILTSRGDEDDRRRGLEAGANVYIAKRSFDQRELLDAVAELTAS